MSAQASGNTSFTQGANGFWQKTHSLLRVPFCQTSWWNRVCFASCSDHQLKGFKWEGIDSDIKMMRSGAGVVFPFTSCGCGRPITKCFRPEQLLSESLLERIGKTRQTRQRVIACGQWFLPKIRWRPGTLTSASVCRQRCTQRMEFSLPSLPPIFLLLWCFHILLSSASPKETNTSSHSLHIHFVAAFPHWSPHLPLPLQVLVFYSHPKFSVFFSNETFFCQPILIFLIMEAKALKVYLSLADF